MRSVSLPPARRVVSASVLAAISAIAFTLATSRSSAQAPSAGPAFSVGKNVDIVGPYGSGPNPIWVNSPGNGNKPYPLFIGDPDKKQENEPSCDVSPTNPLVIFCGMNDYRGVDRPDVIGEPWVGASFSIDGGLSWKSYLHPGFKPKLQEAPIAFNALGFETAADPVVRVVPGLALFNFIAFNRNGAGALFLGRWYERNLESGFPYEWKDTIQIAKGTGSPGQPGRFVDKPAMAISLRPGTQTYDFNTGVPLSTGGTRIQKLPAGTVHVAYAVFTGNNEQDGTRIVYTQSTTYGDSWSPVTTLSETQNVNQAPDIAVDPANNRVVITWRRFANAKQPDAIMYAISNDGGRSFSAPTVLATNCSFTQNTTSTSFRTTTHPFVTFDGTTFHAVWADRLRASGQTCSTTGYSRILISDLSTQGGNVKWSTPRQVDTAAPAGHQFQPSIVAAGNRILVGWFDTRNDVRADAANFADPNPDPYINDYLFKDKTKVRRRSADIYAAQAFAGEAPAFGSPVQVSRYLFGIFPGRAPQPLERNKVNARMFQSGKVPFLGDYIAAAAVRSVLRDPIASPGEWVSSAGNANAQPVFHLAWADNRLVRGDVSAGLVDTQLTTYTPPPLSTQSEPDPTTPRLVCEPAKVGTRDQSVFAAGLYPPLLLGTSSASKSTQYKDADGNVQQVLRTHTVFVQNTTLQDRRVATGNALALRIAAVSPGSAASFDQATSITALNDVEVSRRSTTARTIFVTSSAERAVVRVELWDGPSRVATTFINGNPYAAPLEDPDDPNQRIPDFQVAQVEIHTPDILYRATSIGTPAIDDPAIDDPAIDDPAIDDPAIDDPAIDDPAIDDPAIDDPAIDDPAIDDPAIDDPAIDDPAIDDPAIDDASVAASSLTDPDTSTGSSSTGQKLTQVTWKITLDGNTTTSISSRIFVKADQSALDALNNARRQVIVSRRYRTTDIRPGTQNACTPVRISNFQVIANVVNPTFTNESATQPNRVNPPIDQPSFWAPPGGAVYLTVRVWGEVPGFNPDRLGLLVSSQAGNPAGQVPPDDLDVLPVVSVPPSQTLEATGPSGASYSFNVSAVDGLDASLTATCTGGPINGTGTEFSGVFAIGSTKVTCSATDAASRTGTASFTVNVTDTTAPTIDAHGDVVAEATGPAGAVVSFVAPSATDIVSGSLVSSCAPQSGATYPLGATTVVCSAHDGAGNVASTSFNVIVLDTTAPTLSLPPSIVAEGTSALGATVAFTAAASDVVAGAITPVCSPPSGSTFGFGTTTVTCTASDGTNSSQASFTITVRDTTAPVLTLPAPIVREATSASGATVTYTATALDAVAGTIAPICTPASGSTFALGTTTVNCSATDSFSNTSSGSFTVTVRDTTPPSIVGTPSNITNNSSGLDGIAVTYTSPTATDLVAGSVPVTCSPPSGSTFPIGTTTVTCTASDSATPPNTAQTTFTVTVRLETVPPTITTSVSPALLWPPDGAMVPVTVSGTANDTPSGMASIRWWIVDEYGLVEPSGTFATSNGSFSFTFLLHRYRDGNDKNGRHYVINVVAVDKAGNETAAKPLIVNVHDQSGK